MIEYRVVSNGLNYRVQWAGKTLILRRMKWYWLHHYNYAGDLLVSEFRSESEAWAAVQDCIKQDKAKEQGYIPVVATTVVRNEFLHYDKPGIGKTYCDSTETKFFNSLL